MSRRASAPARALAVTALVCGFVVLAVVVGSSLGGGDGDSGVRSATQQAKRDGGKAKKRPAGASYVVQNGDTLTSIAAKTGVSVARIQALNPEVDPQILISGEKLKLR